MNDMSDIMQLIKGHEAGRGLAGVLYTDPQVFLLDMQRIYGRHWLFVGHVSEVDRPGSYVLVQIGVESIIVVRAASGGINAHFNVCRHRGAPLCSAPAGHVREFVCSYHAWTYDLDGGLVATSRLQTKCDRAEHGLFQCRVHVVEGLIFICLIEGAAPSFASTAADISRFAVPHGLKEARVCSTLTQRVAANWKVVAENSWECYHCPSAHPLYSHAMPYSRVNSPAEERRRIADAQMRWEERVRALGHVTGGIEPVDGRIVWCQRYAMLSGFMTQSVDGSPVAPLMGRYKEYDAGVTGIQTFPACGFALCNDYVMLQRIMPIAAEVTEVKYYWLVDADAKEGTDYSVDALTAFWRITAEEDRVLCEATHRGVSSRRYVPARLSEAEIDVARFTHWYLREVVDEHAAV